jgi:hypothetical protein
MVYMANSSSNPNNTLGTEVSIQKVIPVGATSILISGKKNRISIVIRNIATDGSRISLSRSNSVAAVDGVGIILNQNEYSIDSNSEGYKAWSGDIYAIASTANGSISIEER